MDAKQSATADRLEDLDQPADEGLDETTCSLLYSQITVGEIVRWYVYKCRRLVVDGDFEGSKRIAEESEGFEEVVRQFLSENAKDLRPAEPPTTTD